jgi:hypothetical protein
LTSLTSPGAEPVSIVNTMVVKKRTLITLFISHLLYLSAFSTK